jgi:hypothetical protein
MRRHVCPAGAGTGKLRMGNNDKERSAAVHRFELRDRRIKRL